MNIHKSAVVSSDAELPDDIVVGPYAIIESDVTIGPGTRIEAHAYIAAGSRIGQGCHIFQGAVIGTIPQDLKFEGEYTITEVGDETVVREYATIHRGTKEYGKTVVGSRCLLMVSSHVAHDCILGDNVILANVVSLGGHVVIDDSVIIGGLVAVHQFVHIGKHAFIGGGFRVVQDVPPYIVAAGDPLSYKGLNVVGLRRRKFSRVTLSKIKATYQLIYHSNLNTSQAL